ncbi:MAG: Ig-like domain-containing protein [Chloroflexi bacterium]|nr:Ig-like domain-containing protein [Chloroflexota bacterium]
MQSGIASSRFSAYRLALILVLLFCAGCNLATTGDGAPTSFEGPPIIHIAAPAPNQTFLAGTTVIVQARVENAGPDLARISVLLDDALLGEKVNPNETNAAVLPLTIDWPTSNTGDFRISVLAERSDGEFSREDVNIRVISESSAESAATRETNRQEAGAPDSPGADADGQKDVAGNTAEQPDLPLPKPTDSEPPVGEQSRVAGTMTQPARIRVGPGATYDLVGNLDENFEVMIVAVNPSREWYRIAYNDLPDAWVYAEFVQPAGGAAGLPVETGPPMPMEQGVNLVVVDVQLESAIVCNQPATVRARIQNQGTDKARNVAWVIAEPVLMSDGSSLLENPPLAYLKTLEAEEEDMLAFPLTLTSHVDQEQFIRIVADSGNHLPETDETDNIGNSASFILQPGACG